MRLSTAEIYHEATKYTPAGIQLRTSPIDFDARPEPYRELGEVARVELGAPGDGPLEARDALTFSTEELSRLLALTNGITGRYQISSGQPLGMTEELLMRAAPSAGGLYPTELYLVLGDGHEVDAGIYDYDVKDHRLARLHEGDLIETLAKTTACPELFEVCNAAIVLTAVFERSAWRYEDRAYRRALLDTGHVLGNLALVTEALGRRASVLGGFDDKALSQALLLDPYAEGCLLIVPLLAVRSEAPRLPLSRRSLRSRGEASETPNTSLMRHLHRASAIESPPSPVIHDSDPRQLRLDPRSRGGAFVPLPRELMSWRGRLAETIRARRSSRSFERGPLSFEDFACLLYEAERAVELTTPDLVETYVIAHEIEGLNPGCYAFEPGREGLRLIREGRFRDVAGRCALGQDLAESSAAVIVHAAHLPRAVTRYGDRAYRYLHLDAGHRGQRMNLAAVARGIGVSGIAGFFDDQLNELLGLPLEMIALYLTAVGQPG